MLKLNSFDEFKSIFRTGKKWIRCAEAINNIPNIQENVYYSIGDSLAYMITESKAEDKFCGHRRYMDIFYYLEGGEEIEIAPKSELELVEKYSDETDREFFTGNGKKLDMKQGEMIIVEINEAVKCSGNAKKVIIRVTVEDNYFLNK
ncbi:Evolved beta-galactosidase subunit beta [Fusobacterium necrogenes]|jgi:evolved beta-galactosidase subunit beta|uniref:Evolved beta-galactosidase subunit beta n=1 Tax=Fusobacterium necrogenes TaxID=858 RepID=A0A377GY94_9FUSO|nr:MULTISPECIES: beta-galactosidase subunit beta [Fusobacterium]RGM96387.1 beta-galactosidase subunit beta [Fusobacterium mortiferum]STO31896.1 Evolved beta-galactosidase subunit beta [Fusobacterium necrogenes]